MRFNKVNDAVIKYGIDSLIKSQNLSFVNVTGYKKMVPFSLNSLNPIDLPLQTEREIPKFDFPWCGYFIGTFYTENQEPCIEYVHYGFNRRYVKYNEVANLLHDFKMNFINSFSDRQINLTRLVWIGLPFDKEIDDETLMTISESYGGFLPRGNNE